MKIRRDISSVITELKRCTSSQDLKKAKSLHGEVVRGGIESDKFTASKLVSMYSKCGSLVDARLVFDGIQSCDAVCWNALILGHAENGEGVEALELFETMVLREGHAAGSHTYVAALQACSNLAEEEEEKHQKLVILGKTMSIDSRALRTDFGDDMFVSNALVDAYSKCGDMFDARRVFDTMPAHNVVTWTALVLGFAENGEEELALELYSGMLRADSCPPNALTIVAALKACTRVADKEEGKKLLGKQVVKLRSLEQAMLVHSEAANSGFISNILVTNTLMDTYAHCGSLLDARRVFDRASSWSLVSWTVLIQGCVDNMRPELGLELFSRMIPQPSSRTFIAVIQACTRLAAEEAGNEADGRIVKLKSLEKGMGVHLQAVLSGFDRDIFVANTLLDMYASCGSLDDSWRVFCSISRPTVVTWNAMIMGLVNNEEAEAGLKLFSEMRSSGACQANSLTFVAAFRACSSLALREVTSKVDGRDLKPEALQRGLGIHLEAEKLGFDLDILVANTLVDMYGKCGSMVDALKVFNRIQSPTMVSWTALMLGYVESGESELALEVFRGLKAPPDAQAFVAALRACSSFTTKLESREGEAELEKDRAMQRGSEIYSRAAEAGHAGDVFVCNAMVDLCAKCGRLMDAQAVFNALPARNLVSWNSIILGYVENGEEDEALELFQAMQDDGACAPDARTYMAALRACTGLAAKEKGKEVDGKLVKIESLKKGREVHSRATKQRWDHYIFNSLIDMYAKCGSLAEAADVFNQMECPDVVSWTALISGHVENGEAEAGLELFGLMLARGCVPNSLTLLTALGACERILSTGAGRIVHGVACRFGLESHHLVESALVGFYGKMGCMAQAELVFLSSGNRNLVTWNTLMAAYARQGNEAQVFSWFQRMEDEGLHADGITFVIVLTLCSHAGLVDRGRRYFDEMCTRFGISPRMEHYHCMLDMFARASCMEEAEGIVKSLPRSGTSVTWITMLGACRRWKNVGAAKVAFDELQKLEGVEGSAFVLMSDILLDSGKTSEVTQAHVLNLSLGRELHQAISLDKRCKNDKFLQNLIIRMYGKCGSVSEAKQVFDNIKDPDSYSWNFLIAALIENKRLDQALQVFHSIPWTPDVVAFNSILAMHARSGELEAAKDLFDQMPFVSVSSWNSLIHAYSYCGYLSEVNRLFESMEQRDLFTWTTLLTAYAQAGHITAARRVFEAMPLHSLATWNAILQSYARGDHQLEEAEVMFHAMPQWDLVSWTCLLQSYALLGHVHRCKSLFDSMPEFDPVSASTMIQAYAVSGRLEQAVKFFDDEKMVPCKNLVFSTSLMVALSQAGLAAESEKLFEEMPVHDSIVCNSMLQAYIQRQNLEKAKSLFDRMPEKTTLSWSCMVSAYATQGDDLQASKDLFDQMPDYRDTISWNSLIHGYAWSGHVEAAESLFRRMDAPDTISWATMLSCYARSPFHGSETVNLHREMNLTGFGSSKVSLLAVLDGCNHAGWLSEGCKCFGGMQDDHRVVPEKEHYCSVVDLLCRCGHLESAQELIDSMPFAPDLIAWGTLLRACRIHPNFEKANVAAENYSQIDTSSTIFPSIALSYATRCTLSPLL